MKRIFGALRIFVPVIMALNIVGGVVGGVWAVANGDWWVIAYGLAGLFASHWVISILLMPSLAFGAGSVAFLERRKPTHTRIAFALSSLYINLLMAGWALLVTVAFLGHHRHSSLLPMILLAYGASTGPWAFLAAKDQTGGGSEASVMSIFLYQVGYVVAGVLLLFADISVTTFMIPITAALGLNWWVLQMVMSELIAEEMPSLRQHPRLS